jgi:hypothetical protein
VDACCAINGRGNIAAPIAAMHFRREVFFAIRSTGAEKMAEGVPVKIFSIASISHETS